VSDQSVTVVTRRARIPHPEGRRGDGLPGVPVADPASTREANPRNDPQRGAGSLLILVGGCDRMVDAP
jgi:hypothetical protein